MPCIIYAPHAMPPTVFPPVYWNNCDCDAAFCYMPQFGVTLLRALNACASMPLPLRDRVRVRVLHGVGVPAARDTAVVAL